jgi:hypothetical protein
MVHLIHLEDFLRLLKMQGLSRLMAYMNSKTKLDIMLFRSKKVLYILLFTFSFSQVSFSQENEFRVGRLSEGIRVYVDQNLKMGFMDQHYNKLTGPIFNYPSSMVYDIPFFSEGLCVFYEKQASEEDEIYKEDERYKYGFINKNFQVVISAKFRFIDIYCYKTPPYFTGERAIVNSPYTNDDEQYYSFILIDKNGKIKVFILHFC